MLDPPLWMGSSEIEASLRPGEDCEYTYNQYEATGCNIRHVLLMNMLVLNPDEMQGDEWDDTWKERMEFYLQKTGSISVEHLIHKVQLYVKARDEQRANDEFMCDLMSFASPEDDEMLGEPDEMAGDGNEMEHGDGNEMADAVPAPVVNSPAAEAPMDERAAEEAEAKEENDDMPDAPGGCWEMPVAEPVPEMEHGDGNEMADAVPAPVVNSPAAEAPMDERAAEEAEAKEENDDMPDAPGGCWEMPVAEPVPEMEHGDGNEMADAVPAPVVNSPAAEAPIDERADEADPKEEKEEMLPESEPEVASMSPIKTNDEPPSPLVGPPPPADGSPPPNGLPPPKKTPDDDAARKGETEVETLAAEAKAKEDKEKIPNAGEPESVPSNGVASAVAPMDERADEADPKEEKEEMLPESEPEVASMSPIKTNDEPPSPLVGPPPPADGSPPPNGLPPPKKTPDDDAARKGETEVETLAAEAEAKEKKEKMPNADEPESVPSNGVASAVASAVASVKQVPTIDEEEPGVAAVKGYQRSMAGVANPAIRGTEDATCLNDAMTILASNCAMPTLGFCPSNPLARGHLGWLLAHHSEVINVKGGQAKWQCAVSELDMPQYFQQEFFTGVARLREDSPMLLVSTAVCMLKDTADTSRTSSTRQTNSELPGDLINIHLLEESTQRMGRAMRASVSQATFDSVKLKSAGMHPYVVVAFLQIFTHQVTFNTDTQWLLSNCPSLVTLLYKPVAIVMANEMPRRFLLVNVDELLPPTKVQVPQIFKEGSAAIRKMILALIAEEKAKKDANDKLLFRAMGETRPHGGYAPTVKLDVLSAMPWALKEFHDSVHTNLVDTNLVESEPIVEIKPKPRTARKAASEQASSSASSSSSSTSKTTVALYQVGDKKRSTTLAKADPHSQDDDALSLFSELSDALSRSPSTGAAVGTQEEAELIDFVTSATNDAIDKIEQGNASHMDVFDFLSKRTSTLLSTTIPARIEKLSRKVTDAPMQLNEQDLSSIKERVDQYERHAIGAVQSMHEAAKMYNPAYKPQTNGAHAKISSAIEKVRSAIAEAQHRKRAKRLKPSFSLGAPVGMSPLNPLQWAAGDAPAHAAQVAQRDALAAKQGELAAKQGELAAIREKNEAQEKAAADLRKSEARLRDAERDRVEALDKAAAERRDAEGIKNQATLRWQEQVVALNKEEEARKKAEQGREKAEQETKALKDKLEQLKEEADRLKLKQVVLETTHEADAKHRKEFEEYKGEMEAKLKQSEQRLNEASAAKLETVAIMTTQDKMLGTQQELQMELMDARVQAASFRGAVSGFLASGGGAGPSGSKDALQSLLIGVTGSGEGSPAPPRPPALMPPPPPPPPPPPGSVPQKLLQNHGDTNVPPSVQGLLSELKDAETQASQAKRHIDAASWYDWQQSILNMSNDILTLTALQEEQSKALQFLEAHKTKEAKEAKEATLAENAAQVRALLDAHVAGHRPT